MSEPTVESLFLRYSRRGDVAALGEVFDRTSPELLKVGASLCREVGDLEDALQSTFLTAIEQADRFDSARHLMPWLLGILVNQIRNQRRKSAREVASEALVPTDPQQPATAAMGRELEQSLRDALARLPERYAEVMVPYLAEGRRAIEIAQTLGRAPGTVRMQILRGLDLVRNALPAGVAGGVALAVLDGEGFAAVRRAVLERAAAAAAAGTGAAAVIVTSKSGSAGGLSLVAKVFAALFLVTVGATSWWLMPPAEESPAAGESAAASPRSANAAAAASDGKETNRDGALAAATRMSSERAAAGTPLAGNVLRVRDAAGRLVAGAAVATLTRTEAVATRDRIAQPTIDALREATDVGSFTQTDANGEARIPGHAEGWYLIVRQLGGRYREMLAPVDRWPLEITLEPSVDVSVRVVDEAGVACSGVPVLACTVSRNGREDEMFFPAVTDANGFCILRDLDELDRPSRGEQLVATLAIPLSTPVDHALDLDAASREPIVLTLPPTGHLRMQVTGPDGEPLRRGRATVTARRRGASKANGLGGMRTSNARGVPIGDGVAEVARVGLDVALRIEVESFSGHEPVEREDPGLTSAGVTRAVAIRLEQFKPSLVGRAVDEAGEPLRDQSLQYYLHSGSSRSAAGAETDDSGRFQVVIGRSPPPESLTLELQQRSLTDGTPLASGSVHVGHEVPPGPFEVGDIVLVATPRIATGRVVDLDGRPVPFARVSARPAGRAPTREERVSTNADVDGRFELRSATVRGKLEVQASHREASAPPVMIVAGASELTLTLGPTRRWILEGAAKLPPGTPDDAYVIVRRPVGSSDAGGADSGGTEDVDRLPMWGVEASGRFGPRRFSADPGPFDLAFHAVWDPEPLLVVHGVQPWPVGTRPDPRLAAVDLAALSHLHRYRIVDAQDRPLSRAVVVPRVPAGVAAPAAVVAHDGTAVFASRHPRLALEVLAEGFVPLELAASTIGDTLGMQPGATLWIVAPDLVLPDRVELRLELRASRDARSPRKLAVAASRSGIGGGTGTMTFSETVFDGRSRVSSSFGALRTGITTSKLDFEGGEATRRITATGDYSIVAGLYVTSEDGRLITSNGMKRVHEFELADLRSEHTVDLNDHVEAIQALIDRDLPRLRARANR